MSRMEQLKIKLKNRQNALGTTIANITWSGLTQKIAAFPFDFLIFDTEHGTITPETGLLFLHRHLMVRHITQAHIITNCLIITDLTLDSISIGLRNEAMKAYGILPCTTPTAG